MKLFITTKPNSKVIKVEKTDETHYRVFVKAPPAEGKANQAVIEALSEYFDIPKMRIHILSGHTSKSKVFDIR
ncbi:MAG: hypothetical protein A3G33_09085 [Omnitrophica bacterium RIFCSPLOWO2_12_FULL_44_17]|uniref:Uncharacterized protein n=1 Tax=Candidatus Danuiimicrobium aquiferis TaxID=1801832 RepID=A0A1G1L058_9BACT|nr:MAG: hypothetical protein A3B72_00175 [Omnitrophica bacterium RIFCSPHIGHO2_02_FULL_45_28]OGW98527.1 MAG: hypothetical protein A3G33_09085 [Omnitrophica bacterium RIFCSPLOWO2_12_FULL_44_17]OGX05079.1 MAG: hypothetical protein A3J12_08965 [Omnitrophica bacterium RIFCSPLOWO2_02_FULL_44_11]